MKTPALLIASALLATSVLPNQAAAGDRGDKALAALGGFIGGVIIASQLDHHAAPPPPAVCQPPVVVVQPPPPPAGYWSEEVVQVWVPGQWVTSVNRRGFRVSVYEAGHYESRTQRVWVNVEVRRGDHDDHGRDRDDRRGRWDDRHDDGHGWDRR